MLLVTRRYCHYLPWLADTPGSEDIPEDVPAANIQKSLQNESSFTSYVMRHISLPSYQTAVYLAAALYIVCALQCGLWNLSGPTPGTLHHKPYAG